MSEDDRNPSIVTIGTVKTVKTFFFTFPALNSTAMNKKLKYSISYPIINDLGDYISLRGHVKQFNTFLKD